MSRNITFKDEKICGIELNNSVNHLFIDFMKSGKISSMNDCKTFVRVFLNQRVPNDIDDFNDETFYSDFNNCISKLSKHNQNYVRLFYCFIIENKYGNFKELTTTTLSMHHGNARLQEGYIIYQYNIFNDIPLSNKWILESENVLYIFNFSDIDDALKQNYLKQFIWNYPNCNMYTKSITMSNFTKVLNLLKIDNSGKLHAQVNDILEIKKIVTEGLSNSSASTKLSPVRTLLKYLDDSGYLEILPTLYYLFKLTNVRSEGQCEPYTEDEISCILKGIKIKAEHEDEDMKNLYKLLYYAVLLVANTSMRLTTVLKLKTNSLIESKPGCYYLLAPSKKVDMDKYNITKKTKEYIDSIIHITNDYRKTSNNQHLFIYNKMHGQSIQNIQCVRMNHLLKEVCKENNIRELGFTGIRNKYMQDVTKYAADTGNEEALLVPLSKHSRQVHYTHYYKNNDDVYLQLYGVYIGDLELNGKVLAKTELKESSSVHHKCGYCSKSDCDNSSNLDCLMCKNFVTTPSNIPYFEQEIEKIDEEIYNQQIKHEKEFLISKKQLLVKFLAECKRVKSLEE